MTDIKVGLTLTVIKKERYLPIIEEDKSYFRWSDTQHNTKKWWRCRRKDEEQTTKSSAMIHFYKAGVLIDKCTQMYFYWGCFTNPILNNKQAFICRPSLYCWNFYLLMSLTKMKSMFTFCLWGHVICDLTSRDKAATYMRWIINCT